MRSHEDPNYGSVEYFAQMLREDLTRLDFVDAGTTGLLRSVIDGPGAAADVRAWARNILDAGDLVRAELSESHQDASGGAS